MTEQEHTYRLVAQNLRLRTALRETTAALTACSKAGYVNPRMMITTDGGLTYKPFSAIHINALKTLSTDFSQVTV